MTISLRNSALILALASAAALCACSGGDASGTAPDFTLAARGGGTVSLSAQKGRVVLLNFWATWCDSCKEELPVLEDIQKAQAGDRFRLLAVSVDDDPEKAVPPFAASHGITYPILYSDRPTESAYAVRELPTSFLIAPDGTIARRYVGPLDARAVENDILALLNRRPS
ncbi:MAG TPA: TlpA disulfide reductase family protein [Elusimicrobiota bacterium]|nr:TlpA disulfide reductase family protein [Elusimicrobiota bacterium]